MGALSGINQTAAAAGLFGSLGSNTTVFATGAKIATAAGLASGAVETLAVTSTAVGSLGAGAVGAFAAMAGPIGLGVAAALEILSVCFKGADPNQVPAAQIEQVFEAGADNLLALAKAGYLTAAEAQLGMQRLIQAGQLYYQQAVSSNRQYAQDPKPFVNGQKNMTSVINAEMVPLATLAPQAVKPWNAAAAHPLYIQDGAKGWYSGPGQSIDAATSLTDGFMAALRAAAPVAPTTPAPVTPTTPVSSPAIATPAPVQTLTTSGGGSSLAPVASSTIQTAAPALASAGSLTTTPSQVIPAPLPSSHLTLIFILAALLAALLLWRGGAL
jgi:hypothetical protein